MGLVAIFVWIIALLAAMALLFFAVFSLVSFSDLDVDLNPIDLAKRLNPLIPYEMLTFAVTTAIFLLGGFWIELIVNLPLLAWYGYIYFTKQYRIDPTQVFAKLSFYKNISLAKLVYFMILFFVYLYRMVYYLVVEYI